MKNTQLENEVYSAIAWGSPDRECVGYSSDKFISLIIKLQNYINRLEKEIEDNEEL